MPHIDDGTLHALIDGALAAEDPERAAEVERHLAACEDCRARHERAATLRDEAASILAAAPAAEDAAPDFDDVLDRAGAAAAGGIRRRAAVRRTLGWTRGVAWAATLVIALGTGYLLRDMIGPDGSPRAPAAMDAARQEADAGQTGDAAGGGDVIETLPAPPPTAGTSEAAEQDVNPGAALEADAETDREAGRPEIGRAGAGGAQEERAEAEAAAPPPPAPTPAPEAAPETAMSREPLTGAALRSAAQPSPEVPTTAMKVAGDATRWAAASATEAGALLDGPLYVLPRATVLEVYVAEDAADPTVLTLQRLESGVPVRVVQRRPSTDDGGLDPQAGAGADADPDESAAGEDTDAPAMPGTETARVTRDAFELVLQATLPAELLTILAETARPMP